MSRLDEVLFAKVKPMLQLGLTYGVIANAVRCDLGTVNNYAKRLIESKEFEPTKDKSKVRGGILKKLAQLYVQQFPSSRKQGREKVELNADDQAMYDACWDFIDFKSIEGFLEGVEKMKSTMSLCEHPAVLKGYFQLMATILGVPQRHSKDTVIDTYLRSIAEGHEPIEDMKDDIVEVTTKNRQDWVAPAWPEECKDDIQELVICVLKTMTQREEEVLGLRFGLELVNPLTQKETAAYCGVTVERIRQIEAKALRKLRHPNRNRTLRPLLDINVIPQILLDAKEKRKQAEAEKIAAERGKDRDINNILVEELELSVRAYNCLKRNEILTLADILGKTESELMTIKNFGRKSAQEVIDMVKRMGYQLKSNSDASRNFESWSPDYWTNRL